MGLLSLFKLLERPCTHFASLLNIVFACHTHVERTNLLPFKVGSRTCFLFPDRLQRLCAACALHPACYMPVTLRRSSMSLLVHAKEPFVQAEKTVLPEYSMTGAYAQHFNYCSSSSKTSSTPKTLLQRTKHMSTYNQIHLLRLHPKHYNNLQALTSNSS
jgi:hypothetical protein